MLNSFYIAAFLLSYSKQQVHHVASAAIKKRERGQMILITGASGLIGRSVIGALLEAGQRVRPFDLRRSPSEDTKNSSSVEEALAGVVGIVHLAAISRVVTGERNKRECREINIGGLRTVLQSALRSPLKPWIIFASSREVYGNSGDKRTEEDTPFMPLNTYARTKVAGERLIECARKNGIVANTCRFSTVYGDVEDHPDRVLPAFCRAAAVGGRIILQNPKTVLDPVHIRDATRGLMSLMEFTREEGLAPTVHFVSGRGSSLGELAALAISAGKKSTRQTEEPGRSYDASYFVGDPTRAATLLNWRTQITIEKGVTDFVREFRDHA
jgi:UDP-glucose 4-epimerase